MEKLLEEKGTPAKYREKYLVVGKHLLRWKFQEVTGAYRLSNKSLLHEGRALMWLRSSEGISAVLTELFNGGYRLRCDCWGTDSNFTFQVRFIWGRVPLFRQVHKGEPASTIQDAILLAAYDTLVIRIPPEGFSFG